MAQILKYDFERPWWSNPIVNAIIGGVSVGGVSYAAGLRDTELATAVAVPAVGGGGVTQLLTGDKVFDKSGGDNTGFMRNGAHVENGALVMDGEDDFVEAPHVALDGTSFSIDTVITLEELTACFVSQRDQAEKDRWLHGIVKGNGAIRFGFFDDDLDTAPETVSTGERTRITFTYDADDNERKIAVNGKVLTSDKPQNSYRGRAGKTWIGMFSPERGRFLKGRMESFSIYPRAIL